jgi:hypothetical protein
MILARAPARSRNSKNPAQENFVEKQAIYQLDTSRISIYFKDYTCPPFYPGMSNHPADPTKYQINPISNCRLSIYKKAGEEKIATSRKDIYSIFL